MPKEKNLKIKPNTAFLILIIITLLVYSSRQVINDFLQSPIAGNLLLIVLIAVDGLVPFYLCPRTQSRTTTGISG